MNKINININQQYGNIDLPSQIIDSFQNSRDDFDHDQHNQQHNNNNNNNIQHSRYYNQDAQHQHEHDEHEQYYYQSQDIPNMSFQSSIQDTFLANLPALTQLKNHQKNHKQNQNTFQNQQQHLLLINKTKINKSVLPQQQVIQHVQVINAGDHVVILSVICPQFIQIMGQQGYYRANNHSNMGYNGNSNGFNTFGINSNDNKGNNIKEFILEGYQKLDLPFKITPRQHELGDIYQTIILQTKIKSQQPPSSNTITNTNTINNKNTNLPQPMIQNHNQTRKHRSYIQVQIHYITPKLKLYYQGNADVCTLTTSSSLSLSTPSLMNMSLTNTNNMNNMNSNSNINNLNSSNKISINKLVKNKFGQYNIMIQTNGLQRMQCKLQTRGDITVFPTQLLFLDQGKKKISLKCKNINNHNNYNKDKDKNKESNNYKYKDSNKTNENANNKYGKGVLIVKVKGCKSSFVLAIELLP